MKTVSEATFRKEIRAQGVPTEQITMKCANCGLLHCAQDLLDAGAAENLEDVFKYLGFSCVGRWSKAVGCDWTLGGLFKIHDYEVIPDEESEEEEPQPMFRPTMLVKVQRSLSTNEETQQILIYNRTRGFRLKTDATDKLLAFFEDGVDKIFCEAVINEDGIELTQRVTDHDW